MRKKYYAARTGSVLLAALLTLTNTAGSALPLYASEESPFPVKYAGEDGSEFEKISHKDTGIRQPDGLVDYIGGGAVSADLSTDYSGDRGQSYCWSAQADGDWIYVGTCYAAMGNTLSVMNSVLGDSFDAEIMEATLNAIFNGTFFYGEEDGAKGSSILVKVNVKTGETKLVMAKNYNGVSPQFRNAFRYKDKLYFVGSVSTSQSPVPLPSIYEIHPEDDSFQLVHCGMTMQEYLGAYNEGICVGIRGITEYQGKLIISCVGVDGPYIMMTDNPSDPDSYTTIAQMSDLFDYPAYHYSDSIYGGSIWEMVEYNGSLYVSLCTGTPDNKPDEHTMQSFAIIRGDVDENGNWKWTSVIGDQEKDGARYTFGIDPERTRAGACNMIVYNGYLYIGEYEDIEIALEDALFNYNLEFLAKNLEQSVSLYRMDSNENVELVVGDATKMFPNGSLSGLDSGFGMKSNQYIWQSTEYKGKLYLGTFDSASLLEPLGQLTNGNLVHMTREEWKSQLNYIRVLLELLIQKGKDKLPLAAAEVSESLPAEESVLPAENAEAEAVQTEAPAEAPVQEAQEPAAEEQTVEPVYEEVVVPARYEEQTVEKTVIETVEDENGQLQEVEKVVEETELVEVEPEHIELVEITPTEITKPAPVQPVFYTAEKPVQPEVETTSPAEENAAEEVETVIQQPEAEAEEAQEDTAQVKAMLADAIWNANLRYGNGYAFFSRQSLISLSDEQMEELCQSILNGEITPALYEEAEAEEALSANYKLADLMDLLDEEGNDDFLDQYEQLYTQLDTLKLEIPDRAKEIYGKMVNMLALDNLKAFKTVMMTLKDSQRGCDLYTSEDGIHFETVTQDGFGDPYNHGLRVFAHTDDWLAMGTANPFYGGQVWKLVEEPAKAPDEKDEPVVPDPEEKDDPTDPDPQEKDLPKETPDLPQKADTPKTPVQTEVKTLETQLPQSAAAGKTGAQSHAALYGMSSVAALAGVLSLLKIRNRKKQ